MESRLAVAGRVAAGVAHDINNPSAYVRINLGMLRETIEAHTLGLADTATAELLELLDDCDEGMRQIQASTAELATFAQTAQEEHGLVDLDRVAAIAVRMARPVVRHRARLSVEPRPTTFVHGDESQLVRVVSNLLLNASEAITPGAADANEVHVRVERDEQYARLVVQDTGHGIAAEVADRIFEPFVSTKDAARGTGLGLWVCRQMVSAHGGAILVDSEVGRGSRFSVQLPRVRPTAARRHSAGTAAASRARSDLRPRILIVDDEPLVVKAFAGALASLGEVTKANGGREAQALLGVDRDFQAIVCDLMMPDLDGARLFDFVAELDPDLARRMVFCTGGSMAPHITRFLHETDNLVVKKPVLPNELRAAVRQVVGAPCGPSDHAAPRRSVSRRY